MTSRQPDDVASADGASKLCLSPSYRHGHVHSHRRQAQSLLALVCLPDSRRSFVYVDKWLAYLYRLHVFTLRLWIQTFKRHVTPETPLILLTELREALQRHFTVFGDSWNIPARYIFVITRMSRKGPAPIYPSGIICEEDPGKPQAGDPQSPPREKEATPSPRPCPPL